MNKTLNENYRKQVLGSLKDVFDREAFYPGLADCKPMTPKALLDAIFNGGHREARSRNLLLVHRIYTNGIFAVRLPVAKWSSELIVAVTHGCAKRGEILNPEKADSMLARLEKENVRDEEGSDSGVIAINDAGSYRMRGSDKTVIQVDGTYWETVQNIHKKSHAFIKAPDQPIIWRTGRDSKDWLGILMPQIDPKNPPDDKTVPENRWKFYRYQEFNCAGMVFDKQRTRSGRKIIPGRFVDLLSGNTSLAFEISSRDGGRWLLRLRYEATSSESELILIFDTRAKAIAAVEAIAIHVLSIDIHGHLHFSAEQDVTDDNENA